MKTLSQIGGMIRYEALMQFRRRTLMIIAIFFAVGMIVVNDSMLRNSLGMLVDVAIDGEQLTQTVRYPDGRTETRQTPLTADMPFNRWLADADVAMISNSYALLMGFLPGMIVLTMVCLGLLTETIPLDYRHKVDELLHAAPLSKAVFLAGKVLSVWAGLAIFLTLAAVVITLTAMGYGAVDVGLIARFWFGVALPIAFVASGIAVLLGGLAKTRRTALFIGIAPMPVIVTFGIFLLVRSAMSHLVFTLGGTTVYDSYEAASAGLITSYGDAVQMFVIVLGIVWLAIWGMYRVTKA